MFGPLDRGTTETFWRRIVNGARSSVHVPMEEMDRIPEWLELEGKKLDRRDAVLVDGELNLSDLFGGHELGQQAILFAELVLDTETEVAFGAGSEYWMRWWLDGEKVLDTFKLGNGRPVGPTDHCFRRTLKAGTHLLGVQLIAGEFTWVFKTSTATPGHVAVSCAERADHACWAIAPEPGFMRPPRPRYNWEHVTAIKTGEYYTDVIVECEYLQDERYHSSAFGIAMAVQDTGHYYYAYVPQWEQLYRARAFYAAIGIADGSGHVRNLVMQLMPNVPCHLNIWRTLKVERAGKKIRMWVNGVRGPSVRDETYGSGRVGITGFGDFRVRNLRTFSTAGTVDEKADVPVWNMGGEFGAAWHPIEEDLNLGDFQGPGQLIRLKEEVIVTLLIGRKASCHFLDKTNSAVHLYSSRDGGRTWTRYAEASSWYGGSLLPNVLPGGGWCFQVAPGTIRVIYFDLDRRQVTVRDSHDEAVTWSDPQAGRLLGDRDPVLIEDAENNVSGSAVLSDGSILTLFGHNRPGLFDDIPDHGQGTWGAAFAQSFSTLSHDGGLTWSEPVPTDNATDLLGRPPQSHCAGFSETAIAQLPDAKIVALARPYYSPFMWQTKSNDGARSWRQACYAPFSGAGAPQLVATRSGYLALVKRGPGVGLFCSYDGGVNWDAGTMIDFPGSFNGSAVEVEPDVILIVYPQSMDEIRPSCARAQRIRITPDGPVPVQG